MPGLYQTHFLGGSFVTLQDSEERTLGDLNVPYHLHALLAFLLLLQQLALPADISTITLGRDVLAESCDGLSAYDRTTDGGLDRYLELLAGDLTTEAVTHLSATNLAVTPEYQLAQGIDGLAVDQDVQPDKVSRLIGLHLIVKGSIPAGNGLEPVVEVKQDLSKRHVIYQLDTLLIEIVHLLLISTLLQAKIDDRANELGRGYHTGLDVRLLCIVDLHRVRIFQRVVNIFGLTVLHMDNVLYRGAGEYDGEIELALNAFLHNLKMQHAQETTPEAEAKGC